MKVNTTKGTPTNPALTKPEEIAIRARATLVKLLNENSVSMISRLKGWTPPSHSDALVVIQGIIGALSEAFIVPMDEAFFRRAEKRAESLTGIKASEAFTGIQPQFWCFTNFTTESFREQDIPESYECAAVLTIFYPQRRTTMLIHFYLDYQHDDTLPFIYGTKIPADAVLTSHEMVYGSLARQVRETHSSTLATVERAIQQAARLSGWRLRGYEN